MNRYEAQTVSDLLAKRRVTHVQTCTFLPDVDVGAADYGIVLVPGQSIEVGELSIALWRAGYELRYGPVTGPDGEPGPDRFEVRPPQPALPEGEEEDVEPVDAELAHLPACKPDEGLCHPDCPELARLHANARASLSGGGLGRVIYYGEDGPIPPPRRGW